MKPIGFFILALVLLAACERPFVPDSFGEGPEIVVEGYIEGGDLATPPIVFLTYSQPFYSTFTVETLEDAFVHGAAVTVNNGEQEELLEEICLEDLSALEKQVVQQLTGINPDSLSVNLCMYSSRTFQMLGEEGMTYQLNIRVGEAELEARTTIPKAVPLDSLWFVRPSEDAAPGLRELRATLTDPSGIENYYRYLTRVNGAGFIPGFTSVVEDAFFEGGSFEFPMPKGEPRNQEIDPALFGFFQEGDQVTVKWCSIDAFSYQFWRTLEFNEANQGPFASPTLIQSTVEGGLGIWSGIGARYYNLVAE